MVTFKLVDPSPEPGQLGAVSLISLNVIQPLRTAKTSRARFGSLATTAAGGLSSSKGQSLTLSSSPIQ
jgi:hypothetical protein